MSAEGSPSMQPRSYFEDRYRDDPDPWGFDRRWYERRKYAVTMASLPRERYRRAVEPGCANGALTSLLASRCDALVAYDFLDEVVERARLRLRQHPHVDVRTAEFPSCWPEGTGDLVMWSEIAYYLPAWRADDAIDQLARWLEPGGDLVAVHYTGATSYPRPGAAIGPWLDGVGFLRRIVHHGDEEFELGVWRRDRDGD